jgi:hypothetical protein
LLGLKTRHAILPVSLGGDPLLRVHQQYNKTTFSPFAFITNETDKEIRLILQQVCLLENRNLLPGMRSEE